MTYSTGPHSCILHLTLSFLALVSICRPRYSKTPFFILLVLPFLVLEMSEWDACDFCLKAVDNKHPD